MEGVPTGALGEAYRALAAADPILGGLVERYGPVDPFAQGDGPDNGSDYFAALVMHIVGQQISVSVARVLYSRVEAAAGGPVTPKALLSLDVDQLRSCGLSRAKSSYLLDLAHRTESGLLALEDIDTLDDHDAIEALTAVRGLGLWTAEMFLVHQLHRPDVLPAADVGLRRAVHLAYTTPAVPTMREVRERAEGWSPHRTYAAALLWTSLSDQPRAAAVARASATTKRPSPSAGEPITTSVPDAGESRK